MQQFSEATRAWFAAAFASPTAAQTGAWDAVSAGRHALVVAPTGSGKTLAAFLWSIDRLATQPVPERERRCRVLYVSPLKALAVDVERNLRAPLVGIRHTADRLGVEVPEIRVGIRSGDTPANERRKLQTAPPDILITTPESLFLMLTSQARESLRGVDTVILDEVHAVAGTKRGAHLALSLERLDELLDRPAQRIGLSATVRPVDEVARFLGGVAPVEVVAPPADKSWDLRVVVPLEDMTQLDDPEVQEGRSGSIWPHVEERVLDLVEQHRSTIVFANSRRLAERLTARLNELHAERLESGGGEDPPAHLDAAAAPLEAEASDEDPDAPETWRAGADAASVDGTGPPERGTSEGVVASGGASRPPAATATGGSAAGPNAPEQRGHGADAASVDGTGPPERGTSEGVVASGGASRAPAAEVPPGPAVEPHAPPLEEVSRAPVGAREMRPPAQMMAQSGQSDGAPGVVARAHHGSVSKEQRAVIEDDLKRGRLPCVVATSSLELGIDMGAVDLVIQIESPPSVASALQRVGRAGHQVGETSRGVFFPKHRGDLVPTAVAVEQMRAGGIEALRIPTNPLDVLAQQVVAATSMDTWRADELYDVVRRAASFTSLPRSAYDATLDLLAGRYPSDEFAELRPRLVWDRVSGELSGRPGAQRLAVTSGGTIPDRGLFGVFLVGGATGSGGARVGELDEEMVYESRVGDVFTLGTTSWRIEDITHDRVLVSPAPGQPGRLPFWTGDALGRPAELGAAVGAFTREIAAMSSEEAVGRARSAGMDEWAAANLVALVTEQREATNAIPHDQQLVVERFRDELGDWRLVVHSPYGTPVHAPWALAINTRLRERYGVDAQAMATDDGIVLRIPETDQDPPGAELIAFEPEELEQVVTQEVGSSALFASRFRECAARALLLPRRDPGRRAPLWQQRQRSAQLLEVAARYPSFPIILETVREVLQDVYDVPSLLALHRRIGDRTLRLVDVATQRPSPFAQSLLFGYVAQFMYEGDSPLAERRAAALTLDQGLLAELLGRAELRELLDPDVLAEVEAELQRLAEDRRARDREGLADLLRILGPLTTEEIQARAAEPEQVPTWLEALAKARRVVPVLMSGSGASGVGQRVERWTVVEDVARLRDGLGVPVPPGVPDAFTEPVDDPLGDLVSRYARTHGPFTVADVAARLGLGPAVVQQTLGRLSAQGRVLEGEFRPAGSGTEWCDSEVLRMLRRRSLARLRHEVEPVDPVALARFLPAWQQVSTSGGRGPRGIDGVLTVVDQLAGCAVPASALESLVLPARVRDYEPAMLDELTATGEVLWAGAGALPGSDGWVSLHLAENASLTLPEPGELEISPDHQALLDMLAGGGAWFFRQLQAQVGGTDKAVAAALWDLVWGGLVGNDTLTPLRALNRSGRSAHRVRRTPPRTRAARPGWKPQARTAAPPDVAGRWFLLPDREPDATKRAHATAEGLLERHGVVTRGAVVSERAPGGFAAIYRVLAAFEETGRCRRGYFVEGLGAAQFGTPGAVDRLRTFQHRPDRPEKPAAVALAATDPANPYGAALPWPPQEGGHRPGRKAGAIVVLVDGELALYVERGGKTLLTFLDPATGSGESPSTGSGPTEDALALAIEELGRVIREGALGRLTVEKADGASILAQDSEVVRRAMESAGFVATSRGLRLRGSSAGAGA